MIVTDLVHEWKMVTVGCHPLHYSVFNVEKDLPLLSVVLDQGVQGVSVGNPTNKA